jgi:hypothetical protein
MSLPLLEQRFSLWFSQLVCLLAIASQLWFALDNPRLLAGTALDAPLTLRVEQSLPDRHVRGQLTETGEAVFIRAARREMGADVLTVYRTRSQIRPFLTEGQVKAMQPFFTVAGVTFSWRVFLAAGLLLLWLAIWQGYRRRPTWQPVLREVALWIGRGFFGLSLLAAAMLIPKLL